MANWVSNAADFLVDTWNSGKDKVEEGIEKLKQTKDAQTLTKRYESFIDQSSGGVARLYNSVTGEIVEGDEAVAILEKLGIEPPVPINNQAINPSAVEPTIASAEPIYKQSGKSEAYTIETQGKANGGFAEDSSGTTVPGKDNVPFSPFNQWSMMNYVGGPLQSFSNYEHYNSPINAGASKIEYRNPTATQIITKLDEAGNPGYRYQFGDFENA